MAAWMYICECSYMWKYQHETVCMKCSGILCVTMRTLGSEILNIPSNPMEGS